MKFEARLDGLVLDHPSVDKEHLVFTGSSIGGYATLAAGAVVLI